MSGHLCARCVAHDQIDELLQDANDAWDGLRTIAADTDSPLALLTWLRRSRGAKLLRELIAAGDPPAHDALPAGKAEHYLRSLLVEADILDRRIEPLERLPEWAESVIASDPPEAQAILRRFAQWHVVRRARVRSQQRAFTASSGKWGRQQVLVARSYLAWLADHGKKLEDTTQADIDLWLASGNTRRYVVRDFIAWARRNRLVPKGTKVPLRSVRAPVAPTPDAQRKDLLRRMLNDPDVPDDVRIAGALLLIYGQHLSRVVALRPEAVTIGPSVATVVVARTPLPLPASVSDVLSRLIEQPRRGKSSVVRGTAGSRWLFPGGQPGEHISAEHLRKRLAEYGISLRETRHAALREWALETPAPILATALGMHINTAVDWRTSMQADFTDFVAIRAADRTNP